MARKRWGLVLGLGLLGVAGCRDPVEPDWGWLLAGVADAEARWREAGITQYEMTERRACGECGPASVGPVRLQVSVAGNTETIQGMVYTSSGEAVPAAYAEAFFSVRGLFGLLREAAAQNAAKLEVSYHLELGYPVRIAIDWDDEMFDDEELYEVTALEPL